MTIKMGQTRTSRLLWRESPCTIRNTLQNPSMDGAPRFHYGSIYFKDEVNKPKKVFTQFEKPDLLLHNFRRQLKQVDIQARKLMVNSKAHSTREKSVSKGSTAPVDVKFYERPPQLQLRHDRFGNRSSYLGNYDVKDLTDRLYSSKRNFYSSNRIDLGKPGNFFPGPGTYFTQSHTKSFKSSTYDERMRSSSMKV